MIDLCAMRSTKIGKIGMLYEQTSIDCGSIKSECRPYFLKVRRKQEHDLEGAEKVIIRKYFLKVFRGDSQV